MPADDGTWRITGTKIFISFGEHDMADNVIHLVLARTPDAPPGTKGISCFIVPKFLVAEDGSPGDRNDVTCVSIEHKMGIKASPTCVMSYGEDGGAVGYLIGEQNAGHALHVHDDEQRPALGRARGPRRWPSGPIRTRWPTPRSGARVGRRERRPARRRSSSSTPTSGGCCSP